MSAIEQLLGEPEVDRYLRNRLFVAPMPADVDLAAMIGLANDRRAAAVATILEEVFQHQVDIRRCRTAWDSVPIGFFGDESRKEQAAFELVETGAFHLAALASSAERNRTVPFTPNGWSSALVDIVVKPQFNGFREGLFAWLDSMARLDLADEIQSLVLPQLQTIGDRPVASGASFGLSDTFSLVAARLRTLIPFDAIAVYGLGDFVVAHHAQDTDIDFGLALQVGEKWAVWVTENRQWLINDDLSVEAESLRDGRKFSVLRSALSVPLDGLDGVAGVLTLFRREVGAFSRNDVRVVLAVASMVGMAVETQRTFDAARNTPTELAHDHSLAQRLEPSIPAAKRPA